jgi:hypothetical protein
MWSLYNIIIILKLISHSTEDIYLFHWYDKSLQDSLETVPYYSN